LITGHCESCLHRRRQVSSTSESHKGKGVAVRFPGNTGAIQCLLNSVSRQPPSPLPGGYTVGEQVYFTGAGKTFGDGDRVEHGTQGEVVGPAITESHKGKGVAVRFPGNKGEIQCPLNSVSRQPPSPLPGGYTVGEQVYFTGASESFENGNRLEHGKQGEVVGPAIAESHKGKGVTVLFQ